MEVKTYPIFYQESEETIKHYSNIRCNDLHYQLTDIELIKQNYIQNDSNNRRREYYLQADFLPDGSFYNLSGATVEAIYNINTGELDFSPESIIYFDEVNEGIYCDLYDSVLKQFEKLYDLELQSKKNESEMEVEL